MCLAGRFNAARGCGTFLNSVRSAARSALYSLTFTRSDRARSAEKLRASISMRLICGTRSSHRQLALATPNETAPHVKSIESRERTVWSASFKSLSTSRPFARRCSARSRRRSKSSFCAGTTERGVQRVHGRGGEGVSSVPPAMMLRPCILRATLVDEVQYSASYCANRAF